MKLPKVLDREQVGAMASVEVVLGLEGLEGLEEAAVQLCKSRCS